MSAWTEFLTAIRDSEIVALVGPLYERISHVPTIPTIYVDGGADFRGPRTAEIPTVSIGDGDSKRGGPQSLDEVLPQVKADSDLAYVLKALPEAIRRVCLEGFLGGRRDHELANIGEVHAFLETRAKLGLTRVEFSSAGRIGGANHIVAFVGGALDLEINGTFSVFTLKESSASQPLKISGDCRYPYSGSFTPFSSHGLSNEGHGSVRLESQVPCFIILPQ